MPRRSRDAAGRERGCVRLALDELLAGELGDRVAVAGRAVERVVLLGGGAGERLEPVRVVGGAALHRPLAHRRGDGVGERGSSGWPLAIVASSCLNTRLWQPLALYGDGEDVLAIEDRRWAGSGPRGQGRRHWAPLGGGDIGRAGTGRHAGRGPPQDRDSRPNVGGARAPLCPRVQTAAGARSASEP